MHFIDSTFSSPCINELEKIITDDSDCERDSLIELIFFPDEEIQAKLEEISWKAIIIAKKMKKRFWNIFTPATLSRSYTFLTIRVF